MTTPPDSPPAQLFQMMAETVRDYAIFLLDTGGHVMSWNAGAQLIKQYTRSEIVGKHFSIFYSDADKKREWPTQELKRARMEGRFEDEGWRFRKDGSRFWANVVITALRDEQGLLLAYSKITRDLTERKQHEEHLRESEERFRLLVDGVQDYAIYMLSPNGIVTSWNMGARRITGYEANEIIGKHFSRFYSAEDVDKGKPWTELAVARELGRAEDEGWRIRKGGGRFWARVVVTSLYDQQRTLRGFAKVTQDLTLRRHSEALETSANNLNDFIAVLAHELRNPLAPIRNAVYLQKILKADDPAHVAAQQVIERQSAQLSRIVDDLLDISRITRRTLSIERKPTSVTSIIEQALETARPGIEAAQHTIRVEAAPESLTVDVDPLRINQALTNILNNAGRYTDPGGEIVVWTRPTIVEGEPAVEIGVRDNGRGIDPASLDVIFEMFVQGKTMFNRPAAGLGIGLALARSIVELHHGTLIAHSEGLGKGSEFIITLGRHSSSTAREAASSGNFLPMGGAQGSQAGYRVLVVDDNVDAADMLKGLLQSDSHEVLAINDGMQALDAFDAFRPHIVLLDLGMPGLDGLEVARRMRQRNRTPRPLIVAVTGWSKLEDEIRTREAGFDHHVVKPLEHGALREILDRHARYSRSL